jgi:hypothetical protein
MSLRDFLAQDIREIIVQDEQVLNTRKSFGYVAHSIITFLRDRMSATSLSELKQTQIFSSAIQQGICAKNLLALLE